MSSNQPKGYTIKDFTLELDPATSPGKFQDARKKESGNNSNLDIQRICSGFNYIESIDAASVRCEFIINDSIDLIDSLTGNEKITIELETDSAPGTTLKIEQQIFKIGNIMTIWVQKVLKLRERRETSILLLPTGEHLMLSTI
jgi:hypothetical protein